MHSPAPDQLLRGVADGLEAQVLPALEGGHAQRQLKASLHILRRLERCWDRLPAYLAADAEDMLATLEGLGAGVDAQRARKTELDAGGWSTPVGDLVALHDELQAAVVAADRAGRDDEAAQRALRDLYGRMLEREAQASGTEEAS